MSRSSQGLGFACRSKVDVAAARGRPFVVRELGAVLAREPPTCCIVLCIHRQAPCVLRAACWLYYISNCNKVASGRSIQLYKTNSCMIVISVFVGVSAGFLICWVLKEEHFIIHLGKS